MQLDIIDVSQPSTATTRNGRQYQSVEVTYKNDEGKVQSKKLMSFSNPDVFKSAQTWEKGDIINVVAEKDEAGYWNWTRVLADGEAAPAPKVTQASASASKTGATRVTGSNYETKEERALRQVMIVRQSSLANAVSTLATHGKPVTEIDVIGLAKKYEAFVLGGQQQADPSFEDLSDDVPF